MRKSRFLLSLIAATAIGLSAVGCDSSSSGGIADTTDLSGGGGGEQQRRNLREYLFVGQRGQDDGIAPELGTGQTLPANPVQGGGSPIATPADSSGVATAQLWEVGGISNVPVPNAVLITPGSAGGGTPNVPPTDTSTSGVVTTGFHGVYPSPTGSFVIGISRAKNRGLTADDDVTNAELRIFAVTPEAPFDVAFPPNYQFQNPANPVPIQYFAPDQGEFVSGVWSSNAEQFYASIGNGIIVYAVDGIVGRLTEAQTIPFPNGLAGTNNAVDLIASAGGRFIYALDNANGQVITYARNAQNGTLSQLSTTPTVGDPRSFTLDRSGKFLYVAGRASGQLAGFAVGTDGTLTPIDVIPGLGIGAVPADLGQPLGAVATNSRFDQLFLTGYSDAFMQTYIIDSETGGLTPNGQPATPLAPARNSGNIEVDPTGQFVMAAHEADYETLLSITRRGTDNLFANLNTATNSAPAGNPVSTVPQFDQTGRLVFFPPTPIDRTFKGDVQVFRIQQDGTTRSESQYGAENPYGLGFFQAVIAPPQSSGPVQP